jgi:hypothetical protein
MNCRRRRHLGLASFVILVGSFHGAVRAAPSKAAPVTVAQPAYTAPAANKASIDDFVDKNIACLLNDGDQVNQQKSRDNLSIAPAPQGQPAAPAFLFEYARSVNAALTAQLAPAKKPTLRQRLNAAIVVARIAAVAQNAAMEPITVQLLNDPAEPVVMWALKAAQPEIPAVLAVKAGNAPPRLLTSITPAVVKHPSGPIFDEAYSALNVVDPMVKDELVKLWGNRLTQYLDKNGAPDDPDVDAEPVATLTTAQMWKAVLAKPDDQTDVVERIFHQLSLAAQWADTMPAGEKRDQLARLVQQCCEGFYVVGGHQNLPALKAAAEPGTMLNPKLRPLPVKIMPVIDALLKEIPKAFTKVRPPPQINAAPVARP